ncbi:hypothetical protein B0H12DRAFT_1077403 [Mycena haematopus]|nr:hypothetical protein B0H12DRAFT_1077403 [Mycena haematopus]
MGRQASIRHPKKRSPAQNAQSKALGKGNNGNKENISPKSAAQSQAKAPKKPRDYKSDYQNLQRKTRRLISHRERLQTALDSSKTREKDSKSATEAARLAAAQFRHREAALQGALAEALSKSTKEASKSQEVAAALRKKNKALQQKVQRAAGVLSRSISRAKTKRTLCRVTQKGIYTIQARKLARLMVDAGCARGKVGTLMERVGEIFGVHINRVMSRRTVGRAILEGGVAAKMQITYELGLNQGISISADSTSNRGINIESAHIALRAPDYKGGCVNIDPSSTPKIRSLGVDKTKDHTSTESVKAWQSRIEEVLKAMNGDHASSEKSTANGLGEMKHIEAVKELGEDALAGKTFIDLVHYLAAWNAKKIARLGGVEVWDTLSDGRKAEEDKALMEEIVTSLGKEAYNTLSPVDRRLIDLFIWGGCCMHKDGNSFGGGNAEMMLEWSKIGVPGPILLANKGNAAILRNVLDPAVSADAALSEDELRAFQASTCGGVKTCALAGAIFNNKDDKKGQADKHVDFMTKKLGKQHARFPDTSNTRFSATETPPPN